MKKPDWFEKEDNDGIEDNDDSGATSADGENESQNTSSATHHMLILIDCDPVMFTRTTATTEHGNDPSHATTPALAATPFATTTYMNECMKAIQTVVRNKIRTVTIYKAGKRDGIGILLYNTKYRQANDDHVATTKARESMADNEDDDEEDDENDEDDDFLRFASSHRTAPTNVHEFLPLEPPGVSTMERIQSSLLSLPSSKPTTTVIDLEKEYCQSTSHDNDDDSDNQKSPLPPLLYALRKALLHFNSAACVKKTRKTSAAQFEEPDSKHIWIITPQDDPCLFSMDTPPTSDHRTEMMRLLQSCVKDLQENDIELHVWPISVVSPNSEPNLPTKSFDRSIFYNSITSSGSDSYSDSNMTADDWVNSLDAVYKKTRPAYRVPFLLPNWKQKQETSQSHHVLYLDMYNLHQVQKEPSPVYIHQSTGKVLGKVRQLITVNDGGGNVVVEQRSFDPSKKSSHRHRERQLQTFFEFGNELVPFSLRDKASIKKKCNANPDFASLILLGFKPAASIPFHHTIENSYFAYPSQFNNRTSNQNSSSNSRSKSIDAIAHLHASMIRLNVIGIGELLTRVTATSRLVAIRPIQEILRPVSNHNDKNGNENSEEEPQEEVFMLVRPPGLLISTLPFEDELRSPTLSTNPTPETSEEMIHAAINLIEKQTFDDDIEIGVDFSNAAMSRFWNYIEHIAYNEDAMIDESQQYDTEINTEQVLKRSGEQIDQFLSLLPESTQLDSSRKRKAATASRQPSTDDKSGLDWTTIFKEGGLSKCKVPDLKSKLRSVGESVSGNKDVVRYTTVALCVLLFLG